MTSIASRLKMKKDEDILKSFLKNNPSVKISQPHVSLPAKATVSIPKLSASDIALKKFMLKNPSTKISFPKVSLQKLPADLKDDLQVNLDNFQNAIEREKITLRKKKLREIYYNPSNPAGYGSAQKLYEAAKLKDKEFTKEEIDKWLSKQRAHFLSKTVKKFPRRKVLVRGVQHQYQADLMDFAAIANHNYNYKYVLTVIDCFSRKAFAKPITSKKGFVLRRALAEAFEKLGVPKKLQTDQGSEFFNQDVRQMLRSKGVAHFFTNQELKAQMVERFNRTLRNKIAKHIFAKDNLRFAPHISDFIDSYNNSVHSSLKKFTPNQVNKSNEAEVRKILYQEYFDKKKKPHKFEIGQRVRPIIKRDRYKKMEKQFKEDVFVVTDKVESDPPTYQLKKESNNTAVKGVFYQRQLQEV